MRALKHLRRVVNDWKDIVVCSRLTHFHVDMISSLLCQVVDERKREANNTQCNCRCACVWDILSHLYAVGCSGRV